jgi:hypothetical protein
MPRQTTMMRCDAVSRAAVGRVIAACLPSLADVFFASVLFGVAFGLQGRALGYDGDAAWNLRIGSYILAHGIPRAEFMLSTTLGQPALYWEWLSQTVYAVALRLGSLNGVVTLAAVLVALTSALLFAGMRRRAIPLALALPLALAATGLTSITWTARDQLFSLLLTLLWSEWLWRYWRSGNRRLLWLFPAAMAVWVNLHGGFIAGLILLGVTTAVAWLFPAQRGKAQPRDLTLTLAGSLAVTLVNPWGPGLIAHIFSYFGNPLITRFTQEYQSPDFHSLSMQLFLALVFALAAAWIWMSRQSPSGRPEPLAVAHGVVWTAMALISVRFVPLWAVVVTPVLGESLMVCLRRWLSTAPAGRSIGERLRRSVAAVAARLRKIEATDRQASKGVWSTLALVWVLATVARGGVMPGMTARVLDARFDPTIFPVAAAQRLHQEGLPPGRGFTTFAWGGYLDYALPEYHAFIDSRSDVYSQQLLQDYASITALLPGWQERLDHYAIRWALLPTGEEPLAHVLALAPGWQCSAADDSGIAVLCQRSAAP